MGTNYYCRTDICEHCGAGKKKIHIGKSSAGWYFALHITKELKDYSAWRDFLRDKEIENEDGRRISFEKMLDIIEMRSQFFEREPPIGYKSWEEFHKKNNSEWGMNGLLRSKIDGVHCIGYATRDNVEIPCEYVIGEFS